MEPINESTIPSTLDEAIEWVMTHVTGIESPLENEDEETFLAKSHMSYGQWIRNNWGLWTEDTPIYFWFVSLGLRHADDMSGVVITSTWRKFHGKEIDLEGQVQYYKDFWKEQGQTWPKEPGT